MNEQSRLNSVIKRFHGALSMKINRFLGATALAGAFATLPVAAFAQTGTSASVERNAQNCADSAGNPEPCPTVGGNDVAADGNAVQNTAAAGPRTPGSEIVITGSRITAPNAISTSPITSIGPAELQSTARVSIGDTLNNLPQLQSTFSQANSTRFLGTAGLNLLDLYGLGTSRTLVLVNGRRHVGADILNNAVSPDINTFPTDLIERVDIVTGGNSAVYGSDAIAGVVNFVLKDKFEGLELHGQGSISQDGDAGSYAASVLAGKNFGGGRGNIAINLEYARQNQFFASNRNFYSTVNGFITTTIDPSGTAPGQTNPNFNGIPDALFFRDIRSATISDGGITSFASPTGQCGSDSSPTARFPGGRPFSCNYIFQQGGSLIPETGTRVGLGSTVGGGATPSPSGSSFIGGNGNTRREGQLVQFAPELNRYAANLIGHYDVSDAFTPFIEAKYVRTRVFGTGNSGPAFFTGSTIDGLFERPRLDNPFLSAQARDTIAQQILFSGTNPVTGAPLSAANIAAVNNGSFRFILRKNLTDLGVRSESSTRETYRIVGGARGTFNGDWHYEVSGNYGEFRESTTVAGNVNTQRLLLGLDARRNGAGQIVCGSQIDPTRANSIVQTTGANLDANGDLNAAGQAILNADIAACQPLNPFGINAASSAAKNYILQNTVSKGKITQLDFSGNVGGDTSQFFNLPGGPVYFSIGAEYRRETNFFQADPLVEAGYTFYNALARYAPPSFEVKEAFGELRLPILKDLPFAYELTLSGAGRVSDYKGSAGTVYAYNGGATYAPIRDITFRGTYARSVRAPNLSESFGATQQNFDTVNDPCSARNLANGTQFRAANCAAAGIPAAYDFVYQQSIEIRSGGNPNLQVEKSDSYTGGILLQPSAIPGLTFSSDYYKITVNNVISSVSAQGILNNCYDSPTLSNPFCGQFQRVGAGMTGPGGEQAFRVIEGSLLQSSLNFAKLAVSGINTNLEYTHRLGGVLLNARLQYTHQLTNQSFTNPANPAFADNVLGELSQPKDAANLAINADFGSVFTNLNFRYLSKMSVGAIENHQAFQGRPPQNLDDFDIPFYPDVFYANVRFGFNIEPKSSFYIGVDNLTDRLPPLGLTGIGGGSGIYDNIGRRFYAGVSARF